MRGSSWKYRDDYANVAPLKALMTAMPMTAQQHTAVLQKRIERRRQLETAKELKAAADDNLW
ncbi:hypothetical protein [Noviherbaspirillum sp. UKPF54]|uniref:hypothetical protein n=1 Tax=Noviherbaspirillum sp. UKPF54 TaxID=2601898 RepID=UPI0011B13C2D|nr:hypothetical protein [Noviherbaspirillum sp. UKPF54]QDZ29685.1 hypothetical protein FAY22_17985 [Noviherbaspirillum sp. UKPF54]